ncbi:glycosyltransferase family 4 protein [Maribacter confluentis]|uniref:Glycosyltransferase family 4 protein n=1 Tax=Maribacter confluentis TaxID=1656093 RepID=A0ABT8RV37_9FLAO|nr:glycosyltransferase family 4 protein [Maribacter confluentis]MDO1514304.1 glycosyltransferase family 4 protein [Maribacter confluentis]
MSIELSGQNKQLFVVSELFYPETISTGYIMTEIAKELAKTNKVTVIAGPEFYEEKEYKATANLEDIQITRGNYVNYNKNNFFSRIYGVFSTSWKMMRLMKKHIPANSEILMVTNPLILFVLSSFYIRKKSWNIKLLVHDVFPENLIIAGVLKSNTSIVYKLLRSIFKKAYLKMDTLIVLGRDMKKLFLEKTKGASKITIIENWADTVNIQKNDLPNTIPNFLFAGNLGRLQGLDVLLNALLATKNYNYTFTFIGSGAVEKSISDFISSHALNHVQKLGWLPREQQNEFMAKATIGVISLTEHMFGLGVPSKCYNLLAAGKPILYIGDPGSEIHQLISEHNIGWFAQAGNTKEIEQVIIEIVNSGTSDYQLKSDKARILAEELYAKEIILNKFSKLF